VYKLICTQASDVASNEADDNDDDDDDVTDDVIPARDSAPVRSMTSESRVTTNYKMPTRISGYTFAVLISI